MFLASFILNEDNELDCDGGKDDDLINEDEAGEGDLGISYTLAKSIGSEFEGEWW